MKKLLLSLFLMICGSLHAQMYTINIPCTNLVAASSTNTTTFTAAPMPLYGLTTARLWVYGLGVAATTNGGTTVFLQAGQTSDGPWDSVTNSTFKVYVPGDGAVTNQASANFDFTGIPWLRVGRITDTSLGQLTNLTVNIITPQPLSHK